MGDRLGSEAVDEAEDWKTRFAQSEKGAREGEKKEDVLWAKRIRFLLLRWSEKGGHKERD